MKKLVCEIEEEVDFPVGKAINYYDNSNEFTALVNFLNDYCVYLTGDCWPKLGDHFTSDQHPNGENDDEVRNITILNEWSCYNRTTLKLDWGNPENAAYIIVEYTE